jgi:hypothetical protein
MTSAAAAPTARTTAGPATAPTARPALSSRSSVTAARPPRRGLTPSVARRSATSITTAIASARTASARRVREPSARTQTPNHHRLRRTPTDLRAGAHKSSFAVVISDLHLISLCLRRFATGTRAVRRQMPLNSRRLRLGILRIRWLTKLFRSNSERLNFFRGIVIDSFQTFTAAHRRHRENSVFQIHRRLVLLVCGMCWHKSSLLADSHPMHGMVRPLGRNDNVITVIAIYPPCVVTNRPAPCLKQISPVRCCGKRCQLCRHVRDCCSAVPRRERAFSHQRTE